MHISFAVFYLQLHVNFVSFIEITQYVGRSLDSPYYSTCGQRVDILDNPNNSLQCIYLCRPESFSSVESPLTPRKKIIRKKRIFVNILHTLYALEIIIIIIIARLSLYRAWIGP